MRFNQAARAPVTLDVGDQKLSIPKFNLNDWIAWASELDTARADAATKGMEAMQRFHALNTFDLFPCDLVELGRRVKTPAGVQRICGACLSRATIVGGDGKAIGREKAETIMEANPEGLPWLAEQLADILDKSKGDPKTGDQKPDGEDPLSGSAIA